MSSVWGQLLLAALGSSLVAGLIGTVTASMQAAAAARRDKYGQALQVLIAHSEYPYRVWRRTSNDPATLTALADLNHVNREQLAASRAWVAAESRNVLRALDLAVKDIDRKVEDCMASAWEHPPVSDPAQMLVPDNFGPRYTWGDLHRVNEAVRFRFGWRRILPEGWWRRRVEGLDKGRVSHER